MTSQDRAAHPQPAAPASPAAPAVGDSVLLAGEGVPFRVRVAPVPLACCALEVSAALYGQARSSEHSKDGQDGSRDGGGLSPEEASEGSVDQSLTGGAARLADDTIEVLVVAGTVTHAMGARVRAAYDALPVDRRRAVVAFGACASTGGPYWDSYAVAQGVGTLIPVDLFVPGCPPRPEALRAALEDWARAGVAS